jgi:hypothetical protein
VDCTADALVRPATADVARHAVVDVGVAGLGVLAAARVIVRQTAWAFVVLIASVCLIPGCSLFVMGGRMLMGDTKTTCQFHNATHTDLAKLNAKVIVLCSASDSVKSSHSSVSLDILEGVTHRLRVNGITRLVKPNDVAGWLDEHGGRFDADDIKELAEHFHAEYVIHIEVSKFTCREENSPDLLRGRSEGHVQAYQLKGSDAGKRMVEVMSSDFVSTYPDGNPVSIDKKSAKSFEQEYVGRISLQLAQIFYDHPPAEEMP